MSYAQHRSAIDELDQGLIDGTYKQVAPDRGGVIDPATYAARQDLCDVFYGLHERLIKTMPDGIEAVTPTYQPITPVSIPYV